MISGAEVTPFQRHEFFLSDRKSDSSPCFRRATLPCDNPVVTLTFTELTRASAMITTDLRQSGIESAQFYPGIWHQNLSLTIMGAFDRMDLEHKILMIESAGQLIMQITYFQYYIGLYAVDNYLVEVYFNTTSKQFVNILSVNYRELDKYIKHIDISSLTQQL